jgi:prophage DNA circulation protein
MSEMVLPSVDDLEAGFDKAAEAVSRFDKALLKHVGAREGQWDMEKYSTSIFSIIKKFARDWEMLSKGMDENFKTFEEGVNTITTLIAGITTLVSAFESMKDIAMPSAAEMGDVFDKIGKGVTEFTSVVKTEFPKITPLLTTFDTEWKLHKKTIDDTLPSLKEAISTYSTLISLAISLTRAYDSLAVKEGELAKIRVISAENLGDVIADIPNIINEMRRLIDTDIWDDIIINLADFKTKWDAISKGIKESVDSFSEVVSIFSSISSAATSLTDTFTEMGEIIVITADQIGTAFKDIPEIVSEVTDYIASEGFGKIETNLEELSKEYKLHSEVLEASLKVFEKAINTFKILADGVTSLNSALSALKDVTIISSRDMEKAFGKIDTFIIRFTKALHTNISSIAKALIDLDTEWSIHAKTMEKVMPSYSAATSDINTLISSISSLGSGLISLATAGSITSTQFDVGFSALIKSVSNFAVSLKNNVGPLIDSLQELRRVWIENENVLVPLMRDFIIITKSLKSVADNANAMTESFRNINTGWIMLEKGFERLINFIKITVEAIKEFYTPEAAAEVSTFIKDIGLVIESFQELNSKILCLIAAKT